MVIIAAVEQPETPYAFVATTNGHPLSTGFDSSAYDEVVLGPSRARGYPEKRREDAISPKITPIETQIIWFSLLG